ncbi:MAG: DUF2889 domain-containing protein [Chloroflexota bacterium]
MVLTYTRNKHASAMDLEDGSVMARARLDDTFFSAAVEMVFNVPDLEVVLAKGEVTRSFPGECQKAPALLEKAVGLRVGPGIIKAVNELVGGPQGCPRLADLVLECCDQVIMRFTVGPLREILSHEGKELVEAHRAFLRKNPRLVGSCIAFAQSSPIVKGL